MVKGSLLAQSPPRKYAYTHLPLLTKQALTNSRQWIYYDISDYSDKSEKR
jgi:hypothetical protein